MKVSSCQIGLLAGLALLSPSLAHASVSQFGILKYLDYIQTSNAAPVTEAYAYSEGFVRADSDGDLLNGAMVFPPPTNFVGSMYLVDIVGRDLRLGTQFGSAAEMEAFTGAGSYSFSVFGGALSDTGVMSLPGPSYSDQIPAVTGTTYDDIQLCAPGVAFPVTFATYTNSGLQPNLDTEFFIFDLTGVGLPFLNFGPSSSYSSDTIPGSALKSGHRYYYSVNTYSSSTTPTTQFGGSDQYIGFLRRTIGYFRTETLPGTVAGVITFEASYTTPGEVVDVEIVGPGGAVEEALQITVGYNGYYAFDTAQTGIKSVRFKGRHWISSLSTNVDLSVGQPDVDVTLRNGDVDGDNEVTNADYSLWAFYNGSFVAPHTNGDLDGDGEVTNADYAIWAFNNGLLGD
ncbi:MAG TPA: hypothetical protein PLO61_06015 [Fimbriimonadaceae bacterium]|nr:hypothetical protein [Fimbriimonadaceae bacterium]HRJ34057.1 hypothetical protein [Fimbriimonadaceae bacterium]